MTIEDLKNIVGKNAITYVLQKIKIVKMELESKINSKSDFSGKYDDLDNKPSALPNPKSLTFTGGATGVYDGSEAVTIDIPQGSTGVDLTAATADKLGGIKTQAKGENDTVAAKIGPDNNLYVPKYPEVYMTQTDKEKLDEFQSEDKYAKKSDITTVYRYKGTLPDDKALPESPEVGDTYNLTASSVYGDGMNVAWNGEVWDPMGAIIDLSGYVQRDEIQEIGNAEIDNIWNTVFGE